MIPPPSPHPPELAIVDGTHVCLLPPPPPSTPESNGDGDGGGRDGTDADGGDDDAAASPSAAAATAAVPAVPLRSVRRFLSGRCAPLLAPTSLPVGDGGGGGGGDNGGGRNDGSSSCRGGGGDNGALAAAEEDEENLPLGLVVDLPLRALRRDGRFDVVDASFHSVRPPHRRGGAVAHVDADGGVLVRCGSGSGGGGSGGSGSNNGDNDANNGGNGDDGAGVREDTGAWCASSSSSSSDDVVSLVRPSSSSASSSETLVQVDNSGSGALIADYCGVGGFDQVLILPPVVVAAACPEPNPAANNASGSRSSSNNDDDAEREDEKRRRRYLLASILAGCAMSDGVDVLLPRRRPTKVGGGGGGGGTVVELIPAERRRGGWSGKAAAAPPRLVLPAVDLSAGELTEREEEDGGEAGGVSAARKKKRRRLPLPCPEVTCNNTLDLDENSSSTNEAGAVPPTGAGGADAAPTAVESSKEREPPPAEQPWRAKLASGLRSRLEHERSAAARAYADREVRRSLVERSRRVLEEGGASSSSSSSRLEMVRIRFRTLPVSSGGGTGDDGGGVAVGLNIEVDVCLLVVGPRQSHCGLSQSDRRTGGSTENEGGDEGKERAGGGGRSSSSTAPSKSKKARNDNDNGNQNSSHGLTSFHLSFAPSSSSGRNATSSVRVRTHSGTVPHLRPGECVTVSAYVEATGLRCCCAASSPRRPFVPGEDDGDYSVELSINAHWREGGTTAAADDGRKRGTVLGLLRLPAESILLGAPAGSAFTHEVVFSRRGGFGGGGGGGDDERSSATSTTTPRAIFEHRNPRVLTVDVSRSVGGTADGGDLADLVDSLNGAAAAGGAGNGGGSRIDLHRPESSGPGHARLVVFGRTPEERSGIVGLVLKYLPDSARLVVGGDEEDEDERRRVARALLSSIREEVTAMERHRTLPPESFRTEVLRELACLQSRTDEIAARVKRGWEESCS